MYRADHTVRRSSAEHDAALAAYLRSANLRIDSISPQQPARARVALMPDLNFVHLVAPQARATWTRDDDSLDRVAVVVGRRGALTVTTEGTLIAREPQLFLVPPGTSEVHFELHEDDNEMFYLTMAPSVLEGISLGDSAIALERVDEERLAPALAFIAALCRTAEPDQEPGETVREAAVAVTRLLASQIAVGPSRALDLFTQAMEVIAAEHARTELSAATIGERLRVSARTVQLAFRTRGQTVSGALRDVRVRAAAQLSQDNPGWTRAMLSRAVGFSSVSAYYRAVREMQQQERE